MFKNLSIAKLLAGGTAIKLSTFVVLTAVGMLQVNKINHSLTLINDVNGVKERYRLPLPIAGVTDIAGLTLF